MDSLDSVDHATLAELVREALLGGHLIDRASMPHIIGAWGREPMRDIAIDEWMGASPIYTRRMQRLLGFEGTDVATIFKGMQFDIGAPPQFMDFRYEVHDAHHGEFWLDHCGALMDVEPMGDEYVTTMCHDIEDPTFDATACATNPRARMRPIHRPPRVPTDRHPHCAWTVTIDPEGPALGEPEMAELVATTRPAQLPLTPITSDGEPGARDYAGELVADVDFTAFATGTLRALYEEVSLQWQLLSLSGLLSIAGRHGEAAAADIGRHQLTGIGGVAAERLRDALGLGSSPADVARLLDLHPALRPRAYVALDLALDVAPDLDVEQGGSGDDDVLQVGFGACPAAEEASGLTWVELLISGEDATPLEVIVQAVDPHLRVARTATAPGHVATFTVSRGADAAPRHPDVELARFSTGAEFAFLDEGTRVELRRGRANLNA